MIRNGVLHNRLLAALDRSLAPPVKPVPVAAPTLTENARRKPPAAPDPEDMAAASWKAHSATNDIDLNHMFSRQRPEASELAFRAWNRGDYAAAADMHDAAASFHNRFATGAQSATISEYARRKHTKARDLHRAAREAAQVADPTPFLSNGTSAYAHEQSAAARASQPKVGYTTATVDDLRDAANDHAGAAAAHGIAADKARDALEFDSNDAEAARRLLHHELHQVIHKQKQATYEYRAEVAAKRPKPTPPPATENSWSDKARAAAADARKRNRDTAAMLKGKSWIALEATRKTPTEPASAQGAWRAFSDSHFEEAAEQHANAAQSHEYLADRSAGDSRAVRLHVAAAQAHREAAAEAKVLSRSYRRGWPMGEAAHRLSDAARTGEWVARNDIGRELKGPEALEEAAEGYAKAEQAHYLARDEAQEQDGDETGPSTLHHKYHEALMRREKNSLLGQAKSIREFQRQYPRPTPVPAPEEPTGNADPEPRRRPSTKNHLGEEILPWRRTAEQAEPGERDESGRFAYHATTGGPDTGRGVEIVWRGEVPGGQAALAANDERAHGELHSILAGGAGAGAAVGSRSRGVFVDAIRNRTDNTGLPMWEPSIHATHYGGYTRLHKVLTDSGFEPSRNVAGGAGEVHGGILYDHPDGHQILVSGSRLQRVEYRPKYGPDHQDDMSRAADGASLRAHIKTGAAFEGPEAGAAKVTEAAQHHDAAALAHQIAHEGAESGDRGTPRPDDAARHARMMTYHQSVAARLRGE